MKKILSFLVMFSMVFSMVGTLAVQEVIAQAAPESVNICHATNSHQNPYVSQSPNIQNNGTLVGGHLNHTGPVWFSGIEVGWGDIIPPYTSGDFVFAGLNWDAGQAIYNNGCKVPGNDPIVDDPTEDPKNTCLVDMLDGPKIGSYGSSDDNPANTLQNILNTNSYGINAVTNETGYQAWNVPIGTTSVTFTAKELAKMADYTNSFGYYINGNIGTFVPVAYNVPIVVNTVGVTKIGFALKSINHQAVTKYYATELLLNPGSDDHAVVFNPSDNTYVIAFEDITPLGSSDKDYNDLVVEVVINRCVEDVPVEQTATISAVKIECTTESLLPNWGAGSANITSTTANNWLNDVNHPERLQHCEIVPWTFQWASEGTANPGDNTGIAGGAWSTPFATTATIPAGVKTWVREVWNPDYIPFSGATTNLEDEASKNSAEFYCSTDVLNYDNFDWINPVVAGETYHCVGFNVPKIKQCVPGEGMISSDTDTQVTNVVTNLLDPDTTADYPAVLVSTVAAIQALATGVWDATTSDAGAKWIWSEDPVTGWQADKWSTFEKTFNLSGTPSMGMLEIASDNSYEVWVNDPTMAGSADFSDASENNHSSADIHNVLSLLVEGNNTLTIRVKNWALPNGPATNNPGGLLYTLNWETTCEATDPVTPTADLELVKTVNPEGPVKEGDVITYTITVTNDGPNTATNVVVTDVLPVCLVDITPGTPSQGNFAGSTWTVGTLLNGGSATLTITAEIGENCEGSVLNTATATSSTEDPIPGNNTDSASINVDLNTPAGGGFVTISSSRRVTPPGQVLGQVLGEATDALCTWDVNTYMRKGYRNNSEQVKVLQRDLLNGYMKWNLPVDGIYDENTEAGVRAFQMLKKDKILTPWGLSYSTGIFYKTTLIEAKNTICPEVILPIPTDLINWSQNPSQVPSKV